MHTQVEEALERLRAGTPEDVEQALSALQRVVYGFGMKVCGSPEEAEDTARSEERREGKECRSR